MFYALIMSVGSNLVFGPVVFDFVPDDLRDVAVLSGVILMANGAVCATIAKKR